MGHWGTESCSSDACWDLLFADDIHAMTAAEVADSVERAMGETIVDGWDMEPILGVVIWCLTHGWPVERVHAEKALEFAEALLADTKYLEGWGCSQEREASLRKEIADLKEYLAKGAPPERHIPGLFERMAIRFVSDK